MQNNVNSACRFVCMCVHTGHCKGKPCSDFPPCIEKSGSRYEKIFSTVRLCVDFMFVCKRCCVFKAAMPRKALKQGQRCVDRMYIIKMARKPNETPCWSDVALVVFDTMYSCCRELSGLQVHLNPLKSSHKPMVISWHHHTHSHL